MLASVIAVGLTRDFASRRGRRIKQREQHINYLVGAYRAHCKANKQPRRYEVFALPLRLAHASVRMLDGRRAAWAERCRALRMQAFLAHERTVLGRLLGGQQRLKLHAKPLLEVPGAAKVHGADYDKRAPIRCQQRLELRRPVSIAADYARIPHRG